MELKDNQKFKNKVKCKKCGTIIESKHVHDFVYCKCGVIFVDGGNDYWRYGGDLSSIERIYESL